MSVSTLESSASVRAYDALDAFAQSVERAEQFYADELMGEIKRGKFAEATHLSRLRERYSSKHGGFVERYQTLREFVNEILDCNVASLGEPTTEDAIELICRAANGEDIREDAHILVSYMANAYARAKVEDEL